MLGLGSIFYVSLLLINAMAILNEERFLARSRYYRSKRSSLYAELIFKSVGHHKHNRHNKMLTISLTIHILAWVDLNRT